jgi:hypothetical protein
MEDSKNNLWENVKVTMGGIDVGVIPVKYKSHIEPDIRNHVLIQKPTELQLQTGYVIVYPGLDLKTAVPACDQWKLHAFGEYKFIDPEETVTVKGVFKNLYGTFIRVLYNGLDYDLKPIHLKYFAKSKS